MKHHCQRYQQNIVTRRQMLAQCATGFGSLALTGLLNTNSFGSSIGSAAPAPATINDLSMAPKTSHHIGQAKSVIFLYMDGGPSQVDTFDYKPALAKYNGQPPASVIGKIDATQFGKNGSVLQSPWAFKQYGQSGLWVSDLFPNVAKCIDDICVINSVTAKFPEHTQANYFLHSGHGLQGRPSMGAWAGYGLGSENENLPGFIVLNGGLVPPGGVDNFGSGFLPANFQGSLFSPNDPSVPNITPHKEAADDQMAKLDLINALDQAYVQGKGGQVNALESAIANYEMAFNMQSAVPELMALNSESKETQKSYGLDARFKQTQMFARQCLIARRLVERGVRFIELTCPKSTGDRWDQHGKLVPGHTQNALTVDQPIAALIKDLKQRGLLDQTLILWGGEFGRTPFAQGRDGRDHNPQGFTMWMAGGGIKGGMTYGHTDDFGYRAIENRVEVHDLHATMLHQLGIDHTRLTYRFSGRDIRLTDVHGNVLHDILA